MQYLKLYGQQLVERGYSVIPIPPGGKWPDLKKWQTVRATAADVQKWASNGRANDGIGVLAHNTPAIDLDIEDQAVIDLLMPALQAIFPAMPPERIGRAPRRMFICRTDEPFSKVKSGKYSDTLVGSTFQVEILGDGQQFVAFHVHPTTGQPYTWPGAALFDVDRESLPALTLLDAHKIVDAFEAIAAVKVASGEWELVADGRRGRTVEAIDPDAPIPEPMGLSDDEIRAVLAHINPDEDQYDTWVFTGQEIHHETRGEDRGFELWDEWARGYAAAAKHYAGRGVMEYKWSTFGKGGKRPATFGSTMKRAKANGWVQPIPDDFETLPALAGPDGADAPPLPPFKRDGKGSIEAVIENVAAAARRPDLLGARIAYDAFRDEMIIAPPGTDDWQPLRDGDYTRFRIQLAGIGFKPVGADMMRDATMLVAEDCIVDSAQWWLGRQQWDGKPRVDSFLAAYFGTENTPYARAVSRYLWSALAGRVLSPGCQVDMVPILEGSQGLRKTSAVAAIAPGFDHFIEIGFDEKEVDLARKMRGALVAELGELHGIHSRAIEGIKKFITRRYEKWTPKYKEFNTTFPRRLVFIGTTNQTELLADETGNRRWLPIHVTAADVEGLTRDRSQLWAEGRALFEKSGVQFREAEELSAPAHLAYVVHDAWQEAIVEWLESDVDFAEEGKASKKWREMPFATADVAVGAMHLPIAQVHKGVTNRIGAILRGMGYTQKTTRLKGIEKPALRWHAKL